MCAIRSTVSTIQPRAIYNTERHAYVAFRIFACCIGESKHKYATLQFVSLLVVTTLLSNFIMYSVWGVLLIVFLYLFFKTTNVRSKKYFLMISVLLTSLANIFNWLIGGYYTDMTTYSLAFSFAVSSAIATYIGAQIPTERTAHEYTFWITASGEVGVLVLSSTSRHHLDSF